jgi:hypothetical protein
MLYINSHKNGQQYLHSSYNRPLRVSFHFRSSILYTQASKHETKRVILQGLSSTVMIPGKTSTLVNSIVLVPANRLKKTIRWASITWTVVGLYISMWTLHLVFLWAREEPTSATKLSWQAKQSYKSQMSSFKMHITPKPFSRNVTNLRTMIDFLVHNCLLAWWSHYMPA